MTLLKSLSINKSIFFFCECLQKISYGYFSLPNDFD